MVTVLIRHRVKDYVAWRKVFDAFQEKGSPEGRLESTVAQVAGDENDVVIIDRWSDAATAKQWYFDHLRAAFKLAGVVENPTMEYLTVLED